MQSLSVIPRPVPTLALVACLVALLVLPPTLTAQVSRAEEIVFPPMPEVDLPEPHRVELDNGLVVMLIEDHELPLVEVRALIRTGTRYEPADKVGIAGLVGQVLRSGGTTSRPSDELDELLEDRAARIESFVGTAQGSAFMSCLVDDFPEMLAVFADILRNPAFEEDKLTVARTQLEAGIARQNDNPGQIVARELQELIYGERSPYAQSATYDTVRSITRDDLLAWHARDFHPNRTILGLVGDFETEAALAQVREVFGDWPRGPERDVPEVAYRQEPRPGVFFIEKNDVTQSSIRIGHLGIRRDHPDYFAVELMNQVLGGSFAARLFSRVRSEKGLAYNVGGGVFSQWDYEGIFLLSMSTKVETTAAGIEALLLEARNMTAEPPTEEEVEKARAGVINSFVFRADSFGEILNRQLSYEYYGYPLDWLERYREGIETATVEDVRRAAAEHIHPEDATIVVLGPSEVGSQEGADGPLGQFGEVTELDITIPEPTAEQVEITEESRQRGAELIARAVEAMGGAAVIDAVRALRLVADLEVETPQGQMALTSTGLLAWPERARVELETPGGTLIRILDGDRGVMKMGPNSRPLPDSMRDAMRENLMRNPVALLQLRGEDDFLAAALGPAEVEGQTVERVLVEVAGLKSVVGLDPESGRILTHAYRGPGPGGAPSDLVEVFSDYRQVDGLWWPFATRSTSGGEPGSTATYTEVEVNVAVTDADFATE